MIAFLLLLPLAAQSGADEFPDLETEADPNEVCREDVGEADGQRPALDVAALQVQATDMTQEQAASVGESLALIRDVFGVLPERRALANSVALSRELWASTSAMSAELVSRELVSEGGAIRTRLVFTVTTDFRALLSAGDTYSLTADGDLTTPRALAQGISIMEGQTSLLLLREEDEHNPVVAAYEMGDEETVSLGGVDALLSEIGFLFGEFAQARGGAQ